MNSSNISIKEELSNDQIEIIKEMKRDLIKIIPLMTRSTRRRARDINKCELYNLSCDNARACDHMIPTISFRNKCCDFMRKSIDDRRLRTLTSRSTERTSVKVSACIENSEFIAEELVYPSVNKLKTWMSIPEGNPAQDVKGLKRILLDHIKNNMKFMNLKISNEIEGPSVTKFSTETYHLKLPDVPKLEKDFKQIKVNHKKNGIMRRNKLLLEHIIHERIRKNMITPRSFDFQSTHISTTA